MTFYFGMLVVVPDTEEIQVSPRNSNVERVTRKVWRIEDVINLSAVKIFPGQQDFMSFGNKFRARSYLLDMLWPAFSQHLDSGEMEFAPRFVIYEDDFTSYPERWPEEFVRSWSSDRRGQMPGQRIMDEHHYALKEGVKPGTSKELQRHSGVPFPWVECHKVLEMIEAGKESSKEIRLKDVRAQAFLKVWMNELHEFGQIGGRVIFLMHDAALDSFGFERF
jgi:hypothetical protein